MMYRIDINWAEEQYYPTLLKVIREMDKVMHPPKKKDITLSEMQSFIE